MANKRKFDVVFRNARIFINRMILMVDMPCFHWRYTYWLDSKKEDEVKKRSQVMVDTLTGHVE